MDLENEISPSKDEFDFELFRNKIDCIHQLKEINDRENESSNGDSDKILDARNLKKIRI